MTLLTLAAATRRVASVKGNYSKADAITGKQYPKNDTRKVTVSEPSAEIKKLQDKMNVVITEWYNSGGKTLLNLGENAENWDTIINLVDKLYDPVFAGGHLPSTLCDSSSLGAAIFASLATVIEEKLSVLCGDEGVLLRSKNNHTALLSNDTLSNTLILRIDKMAKVKKRNINDAKEKEMLLYRMSKLKEAPLPHRLSLFENFGDETRKEEICSSASAVAGTTVASDMHCKLVNHVFKVAFRKSGPGRQQQQQQHMVETHALSKYVLEYMNGRDDFYPYNPDSASIFYCDYNDFKAYQALPDKFKMSSIIPGSHNMEDLPFRPFAVPAHYKTGERRRIFKYERAVPLYSGGLCFDYGEFLCYCIFGVEWDKHLGDIVDALGHSPMTSFSPNIYSGVFKDTYDFNRLGNIRMGVVDFALRSVAEFIRSEAYDAANKEKEEKKEEEENVLSTLRNTIRNSVQQIRSFLKEDLPNIVSRFKRDLPAGDYGEPGEFECLTAHLFLSRLLDECHILRNMDIQRTVFSTRISLMNFIAPRETNTQTYSSVEEIPDGVLAGLSGNDVDDKNFQFPRTGGAVVSWDGSTGKVIGVWRNSVTGHYLSDHESVAKKYKNDLKLVKTIKNVLREASEKGDLNPVFFNREAIYRALHAKGIFVPGMNLTETGKSFEGLRNLEEEEEEEEEEKINDGEFRGVLSGLIDILETKALTVYTRDAFRKVGEGIRTEAEALTATETALMKSLSESFRTDTSLGLDFSADTQSLILKDTKTSLLEETKALRANKIAFSSLMKSMGVQVSKDLDVEFAAEMRETYPDTAIREFEESAKEFQKNIPESQVREIEEISREAGENLEKLEQKINDTELSKIIDSVLAKKLGNGVLVFVGRFATASVLVGTVVVTGFLGPAVLGTMHASRGAHLNVVYHTNKNGVTSYTITDTDKKLGWTKRVVAHPFRKEIGNSDNEPNSEACLIKKEGGTNSRNKAWAPAEPCYSWSKLPKGQSLTCDKEMTAMQALVDTLKSLGGDVANTIFGFVGDAVVAEKASSTIINSPGFIVSVPIAASIAATKLQPANWKTGLTVGLAMLVLILVVRFFAGSGAFTLNWFSANDKSKRKYTEAYEMGKIMKKQNGERRGVEEYMKRNRDRDVIKLRPAFLPATTNYSRAAKILGADMTLFADCYRDVRHKMRIVRSFFTPHQQ
uniref:Wsv011-like protein n=1 Tax=Sesarmops intermedium nimavirus TaxID=2133796 RepID=A0A401IPN5_9VIRU|nr:MAG: wsv011-like protein [Sesarmops intermedium nimavirus]GBG35576.1 wsv011-like protein [Sesarmops intermedium nimavirus]